MKRPVTVSEAIADLAALRSSDPAARHAMQAIRLTRLTLESFWIDPPTTDAADEALGVSLVYGTHEHRHRR